MMVPAGLELALAAFITNFGPFSTVTIVGKDSTSDEAFNYTALSNMIQLPMTVLDSELDIDIDSQDLIICLDECDDGDFQLGAWLLRRERLRTAIESLRFDSDVYTFEYDGDGVVFHEVYGLKERFAFHNPLGAWGSKSQCKAERLDSTVLS